LTYDNSVVIIPPTVDELKDKLTVAQTKAELAEAQLVEYQKKKMIEAERRTYELEGHLLKLMTAVKQTRVTVRKNEVDTTRLQELTDELNAANEKIKKLEENYKLERENTKAVEMKLENANFLLNDEKMKLKECETAKKSYSLQLLVLKEKFEYQSENILNLDAEKARLILRIKELETNADSDKKRELLIEQRLNHLVNIVKTGLHKSDNHVTELQQQLELKDKRLLDKNDKIAELADKLSIAENKLFHTQQYVTEHSPRLPNQADLEFDNQKLTWELNEIKLKLRAKDEIIKDLEQRIKEQPNKKRDKKIKRTASSILNFSEFNRKSTT